MPGGTLAAPFYAPCPVPRRLTFLVPALFWPDPAEDRPYAGLELPALHRLLGRAAIERLADPSVEDWLAQRFGLAPDRDIPAAALSLLAHRRHPADRQWMRADPVHLQPQGTELFLVRGADLGISADEAAALTASLGELAREDGLVLEALTPAAWLVGADALPRLRTTPLSAAHGRSIDPLLPTGDDARRWMRLLSEMQMLLHAHPVNSARETAGRPTINSVWLWGTGALPDAIARPFDAVVGGDTVTRGLALQSGARILSAQGFAEVAAVDGESVLVDYRAAEDAAARGDGTAWRAALQALDHRWLGPALEAVSAGRLARIAIAGLGGRVGIEARLARGALRRFWRRPRTLAAVRPR